MISLGRHASTCTGRIRPRKKKLIVFAEVISLSPIKVRVSKNAIIIEFFKLSDVVTLCEPYGGLDGALNEAEFFDELLLYKRPRNGEHKAAELKNGLFAKSAIEVSGKDVTISQDAESPKMTYLDRSLRMC